MKIAIMQPYFFPYIGYFQLINRVDKFIFYDDVNFIKRGWINRNRLFLAGSIRYITVPLSGASQFEKINKIHVKFDHKWIASTLDSIRQSYHRAPFYGRIHNLIETVLHAHDGTISNLSIRSVIEVLQYLGIEKDMVKSSVCYNNQEMKGSARILDICTRENAKEYWNLPGGRNLYREDEFLKEGIKLKFLEVRLEPYKQFTPDFVPGLSILDVLMFNDREKVKEMIGCH